MLAKYKRVIKYIAVVLVTFIVCICAFQRLPLLAKHIEVVDLEDAYLENKDFESWSLLCNELYNSEEYEKILEYYPDYLNSSDFSLACNFSTGDYSAHKTVELLNAYKYTYANAMLKTNKYDEFEDYVYELYGIYEKVSMKSNFYLIVSDYILTSKYNDEQYNVLLNIIKGLYDNCDSVETQYQNLCIQLYIYSELSNKNEYDVAKKEIQVLREEIKQRADELSIAG